jgi:hypothetical protein
MVPSSRAVAFFANWVTVMVCELTPVPEIVIVAVRAVVPGLADAVKVTVPLFEPDAGFNVNQASELAELHPVLEVIVNVALLLASALTFISEEEINRAGAVPDCVTLIVWDEVPAPDIVTVVVRTSHSVFAVAVKVMDPFPEPDSGLTVSQVSELATFQLVLDVIPRVAVLLAPALTLNSEEESNKVDTAPDCVTLIV